MKKLQAFLLLIAFGMMPSVALGRSDDFFESHPQAGKEAYRQRRLLEAVDSLRVASFGFLDRPALLSESLARLALAYAASGRPEEAKGTLERLLVVERRFGGSGQAALEPELRASFQALVSQRAGGRSGSSRRSAEIPGEGKAGSARKKKY